MSSWTVRRTRKHKQAENRNRSRISNYGQYYGYDVLEPFDYTSDDEQDEGRRDMPIFHSLRRSKTSVNSNSSRMKYCQLIKRRCKKYFCKCWKYIGILLVTLMILFLILLNVFMYHHLLYRKFILTYDNEDCSLFPITSEIKNTAFDGAYPALQSIAFQFPNDQIEIEEEKVVPINETDNCNANDKGDSFPIIETAAATDFRVARRNESILISKVNFAAQTVPGEDPMQLAVYNKFDAIKNTVLYSLRLVANLFEFVFVVGAAIFEIIWTNVWETGWGLPFIFSERW